MSYLTTAVVVGTVAGTLARLQSLKIDYRQYPSYPQGYTIHMSLAVIAAFLGSVAAPALAAKDFAAASFLALAATQFREVRNIERETLLNLEESELVPRGAAYIEGIARVFEARNYLTMLTGLAASGSGVIAGALTGSHWGTVVTGIVGGAVAWYVIHRGVRGKSVGDLVDLRIEPIQFDGPMLTVAGVGVTNIADDEAVERYRADGIGVLMIPKNPAAKATMANAGQRQAIAHDASTLVGLVKEIDEPHLTPLVRRDGRTGNVVLAILPAERSPDALLEAIRRVPVLEAAVRKPISSPAGRMVD